MNKTELVREIANEIEELTQKEVAIVLDKFQEVAKEVVKSGEDVKLNGFLTFYKKHVDEKSGVSKIGGKETPWKTEDRDEVAVKLSKSYKVI